MINLTKTNNAMNNNNIQNTKAARLAGLIAEIVINKGTCFAGFDYAGKRRNLTIGANLSNRIGGNGSGKGIWGKTYAKGSLVEHNGNIYLQGIPNNEVDAPVVKRFKLSEVENLAIG